MKLATTIVLGCILGIAGCGVEALVLESDGSETVATSPNTPAPLPAQPPLRGPTPFDPAGVAAFGFEDADILTSLLADQLVLELLAPSGPALEFTFLERLCLEGDDPDFYCHQRYGR